MDDAEPNPDLHRDIDNFFKENDKPTSRLKSTAMQILTPLGYADKPTTALQYSIGEGVMWNIEQKLPEFGKPLTTDELAGQMTRIPNHNEALALLNLAMYGRFPENHEGDRNTVTFSVEESPIEVSSGIGPDGGFSKTEHIPNRGGTDRIAESLIRPEFLIQSGLKASEVVGKLGSTGTITLEDPGSRRNMTITRNIQRGKDKQISSYSYTFQIKLI